jgi:hypothetical protein
MRAQEIRVAAAILIVCILGFAHSYAAAAQVQERTYVWFGELVAFDESSNSATVKARIPDYVAKYVDRFKSGDRVLVVWDMIGKKQADRVLAIWKYDDVKDPKGANTGYVLPVEFVSADVEQRTVTFKARVSGKTSAALKSAQPGQWLKVTAPMDQPSQDAVITSIDLTAKPQETAAN